MRPRAVPDVLTSALCWYRLSRAFVVVEAGEWVARLIDAVHAFESDAVAVAEHPEVFPTEAGHVRSEVVGAQRVRSVRPCRGSRPDLWHWRRHELPPRGQAR